MIKLLVLSILAALLTGRVSASVLVTQYGAKGDGVTNDQPAFIAALASGQEVRVPRAVYYLQGSITLGPGASLIGERNPTLLPGPAPLFVVASSYDTVKVSGFRIDCRNNGTDVFAFNPNTYDVHIENCTILNGYRAFVQYGTGNVGLIYCDKVSTWGMTGPSWTFTGGSGLWLNDCTVIPTHPGAAIYCVNYGGIFLRDFNSFAGAVVPDGGFCIDLFNCFTIELETVLLDGLHSGGILFSNCFNIAATNVTCWGCAGTGLEFIVGSRGVLSNIVSNYSQTSSGIVVDGSDDLVFSTVATIGNASSGLIITSCSTNKVTGIDAKYNGGAQTYADPGNVIQ
jgi:hypothetical protein